MENKPFTKESLRVSKIQKGGNEEYESDCYVERCNSEKTSKKLIALPCVNSNFIPCKLLKRTPSVMKTYKMSKSLKSPCFRGWVSLKIIDFDKDEDEVKKTPEPKISAGKFKYSDKLIKIKYREMPTIFKAKVI